MTSNPRETSWRVFANELNGATYEIKTDEEMKPTYQLSKLGAMINRVLVIGVLTEKENVGTEDEPMWRGRVQDDTGTVFINVGRFQQDASAAMVDLEAPCLVAVIGKVRSYTTDDQRTFVSVRPERIVEVDDRMHQEWLLNTARSTWDRLVAVKKALNSSDISPETLRKSGMSEQTAKGISLAIEQYGIPDSSKFLRSVQTTLRSLLPDKNVDLGLPEDNAEGFEEMDFDQPSRKASPVLVSSGSEDKEDTVLSLLAELDRDGKGAARDELESRAMEEGISSMELEELTNSLMDKGLVYEPNLRYLKRI